ncbi:MAG: sensor histidine kinase [Candidatus Berkiella sp.]
MKTTRSIAKICFQAAFWPALILILLSCLLSGILFTQHMQDIHAREINRHELIYQLLSKAIIGDIIIQNKHATYAVLNEFKNKHTLKHLAIVEEKPNPIYFSIIDLLSNKTVSSSWKLAGISPNQCLNIESMIKTKDIAIPLSLSLGIILIFITAALLMYQRIRKQLHFRIVKPLKYTLDSDDTLNKKQLNFNSAATEIRDLYHKTQSFITELHEQRDVIEKNKIEDAKYQMALQVAHDIRSPVLALETISTLSSELKEENKNLINKVTKRILQIADNILETHTPTTMLKTRSESLTIGHIIENLVAEKKIYCNKLNITFNLSLDPISYHTHLQLSEEQLNRILSNLVDNAIEAIDNQGTIQIITEIKQNIFCLSLTDSGCGIPAEKIKHIFDKVFPSSKSNGHGLGLPYVKQLVEAHGGKIYAQSNIEQGTRIDIKLPILQLKEQ